MKLFFILNFFLGSLVVFQPSLNRMIFDHKGQSFTVFLNASVLFTLASLLFLVVYFAPEKFSPAFRFIPENNLRWWYVVPGAMGFLLVLCVPIMIKHIGAFPTIVTMILGQVATSFLWDVFQEGVAFNGYRMLGLVLVMAGVYFSFRPSV